MLFNRLVARIADSHTDNLHPFNLGRRDINSAEANDKDFDSDVVSYLEAQFRSWSNRQLKVALLERNRKTTGT